MFSCSIRVQNQNERPKNECNSSLLTLFPLFHISSFFVETFSAFPNWLSHWASCRTALALLSKTPLLFTVRFAHCTNFFCLAWWMSTVLGVTGFAGFWSLAWLANSNCCVRLPVVLQLLTLTNLRGEKRRNYSHSHFMTKIRREWFDMKLNASLV